MSLISDPNANSFTEMHHQIRQISMGLPLDEIEHDEDEDEMLNVTDTSTIFKD